MRQSENRMVQSVGPHIVLCYLMDVTCIMLIFVCNKQYTYDYGVGVQSSLWIISSLVEPSHSNKNVNIIDPFWKRFSKTHKENDSKRTRE